MSELISLTQSNRTVRWHLLSTVSVVTLVASVAASLSKDDVDRPTVWIELGGQLERVTTEQSILAPPFIGEASPDIRAPMAGAQMWPRYSVGGEGRLIFAPEGSDWSFSATVRYGRSNANRHLHHQTAQERHPSTIAGRVLRDAGAYVFDFGDGQSKLGTSHTLLDFQAGKDVALGLFGGGSHTVFSLGVRYAQFNSSVDTTLHAGLHYHTAPGFQKYGVFNTHKRYFNNYNAMIDMNRSTHAVGPSLAWDSSVSVGGNDATMAVSVDWGVNGALLFGRQRTRLQHQSSGAYYGGHRAGASQTVGLVSRYIHGPYAHNRRRSVTIPDVGGFAGASLRFPNAKVSLGYRADFFFNAVDTGIDTTNSSTVGFYGPFATISVGLGG